MTPATRRGTVPGMGRHPDVPVADYNYSWSNYQTSLADAVATNRRVSLLMGKDFLNPNVSGEIRFVWGNGYADSGHTAFAASMGRRNTCLQNIGWSFPVQSLAGPGIQLSGHDVQLSLADRREIHSLGIVLSQ